MVALWQDSEDTKESRLYYYGNDEQGSIKYLLDESGEIENQYRYDAFGVILKEREEVNNPIKYTGQEYDKLSEQYYLRARFYNPVTGRFLQEDRYRGDGFNLYAYCRNNPVVYCDISGYSSDLSSQYQKKSDGNESIEGAGEIEFPLNNGNKQHIKKHTYQGMKEQANYLTDEQLAKNLEKNSFFNPEWSIDDVNKYAEEAFDALRKQDLTGNLTYEVNGEVLELFIHPDGSFGTVFGQYKLSIEDFR